MYRDAKDSLREKDWRWLRVTSLLESQRRPTKRDDKYITRAYSFFKRRKFLVQPPCEGKEVEMERLQAQHPELEAAYRIFEEGDFSKWALEALALGRLAERELARAVGQPEEIIHWYEALFFDVRDRLDYPLAIKQVTMGPAVLTGLSGRDYDYFWKSLAYHCGALLLLSLWSLGELTPDAEEKMHKVFSGQMRRNAMVASFTRDVNKYNAGEVIQEYLALLQLEREGEQSTVLTAMSEGTGLLLGAVTVSLACVKDVPRQLEPKAAEVIKRLAEGRTYATEAITVEAQS